MKKVLILGAGIYQVPLIKKARELGIYTIVTSIPGDYPGFALADQCYFENTTDKERILEIAEREQIDGILTSGTDVAVSTIGCVCEDMNLNGITEESARLVTDKAEMKRSLAASGVRTAAFRVVHDQKEAEHIADDMGLPVVLKCVDSSGSRGIEKITDIRNMPDAFCYALSSTRKDYVILEKFLEGHEIGLDGFVCDDIRCFFPHDKIMYHNGRTNVPIGHVFPYDCSEKLYLDILDQAQRAIMALGLNHCFFNMDIMISSDRAYIIEVGGRAGATCIPELISIHCGIDYYRVMLEMALGKTVDADALGCGTAKTDRARDLASTACAGRLIFSEEAGVLESVSLPCDFDGEISLDVEPGAEVPAFLTGNQRLGQIITSADTVEQVLQKLNAAISRIVFRVRGMQ